MNRVDREASPFDIEDYLRSQKEVVDTYLDRLLPPAASYPQIINEAIRYSVFAGGKRIRPILALATGEALEGDFQKLIYLGCALEMLHTYSLIHDDLPAMDDDDYRRGHLTSHKKFGEAIAILAGDGLQTLAFQTLSSLPVSGDSALVQLQVINRIARAVGVNRGMIAGQVVDITTQGRAFSREQLEYIHSSKTGALIQASVNCAVLLSSASEDVRRHLSAFGSSVGLAFQIVDDILDEESSFEELGKTSGKDRANRKATYPAMFGMQTSRKVTEELVEHAMHEIAFLGARGEVLRELTKFISIRRF
jgi:geranylgeranyl diphosphate synthase, type II